MSDERPRPQYGEYATPEQQAAAMGRAYIPPPAPETRVTTLPRPGHPDEPRQLALDGNVVDRFVTIFQLGIGLVFLINSNFFQLAEAFNAASSELGVGGTISTSLDSIGWLLLAVNIVLFLATTAFAFWRLRRRKLAFFVPAVGLVAFYVFLSIVLGIFIER